MWHLIMPVRSYTRAALSPASPSVSPTINVHSVVMKELDVRGTIAYCNDHQETIRLVEQGKLNLEPFITQRIQLEDLVSQGFETLIHNNESAVKIIVQPRLG